MFVLFGDDYRSFIIPPKLSLTKERLMQTDSTEEQVQRLLAYDGEFTQTWDTVGAGVKSHAERA